MVTAGSSPATQLQTIHMNQILAAKVSWRLHLRNEPGAEYQSLGSVAMTLHFQPFLLNKNRIVEYSCYFVLAAARIIP